MEHTEGELEYIADCDNSISIVSANDEARTVAMVINDETDLTKLEFANAAHLVHCWNAHAKLQAKADCFDELVTALEIGRSEMELWERSEECDCPAEGHICGITRLRANIVFVKQALAKAKKL